MSAERFSPSPPDRLAVQRLCCHVERSAVVIIPRRQSEPEPEPSIFEKFGNQIIAGLALAAATSIASNLLMIVSVPEKLKALGDRVEVLVREMNGYRQEIREVNREVQNIKLDLNTLKLKD
jgi:hypothetical protein